MNICIPVEEDRGLASPVCAHFGSAPAFLVVDTDTQVCRAIVNQNVHGGGHGSCRPVAMLAGEQLDALVVGGIGMGALSRLLASNIQVYLAEHATVRETLAALAAGTLRPVDPASACAGHSHGGGGGGGGCGHGGGGRGRP